MKSVIRSALWCALGFPVIALAGVATPGFPPVQGFPTPPAGTGSATAATASAAQPIPLKSRNQPAGSNPNQVPSIGGKALPPSPAKVFRQMTATPPQGPISKRTKALMRQSLQASGHAIQSLPVHAGQAGSIAASASGRPVLICSPLHTCVITLPKDSKPTVTVGVSKAEWNIQQAMVGRVPEIFLSPKFAGLHQNLVVAATLDGQTQNYQVRLVSDNTRYIPVLRLQEQDVSVRTWAAGDSWSTLSAKKPKMPAVLPLPNVHMGHVNTDWRVSCGGGGWFSDSDCGPIRPVRVFDDGKRTYIQMPAGLASHGGYPILQAKDRSGQFIGVNTQIRGNTMVVDSVPNGMVLRLGKEVVDITRTGGR